MPPWFSVMSSLRRALIVGCGKIAGGYNRGPSDSKILTHALAYRRHPGYELVACVDPNEARRSAFAGKWGLSKSFATLEAALENDTFDVVSICSPTGKHLAALDRLADSQVKAVFAEKPLDGKPESALEIGAKFAARNIPVAVNFGRRFDSSIQALRSEIASGRFGKLVSAIGWYSGGVVNNGSHMVDLAVLLTARHPRLQNVLVAGGASKTADPTVSALLGLDGAPFHLVGQSAPGVVRFELELSFDQKIVTLEEGGQVTRIRPFTSLDVAPELVSAERGEWRENDSGSQFLTALDEIAEWKPGKRLSSDIESACEAIAVVAAIRTHALEKSS
jgi:predicted dehydrogenase